MAIAVKRHFRSFAPPVGLRFRKRRKGAESGAPVSAGIPLEGNPDGHEAQGPQEFQSKWTLGKLLKRKESWAIMIGMGVFSLTLAAVISQFFNSLMSMGLEMSTCSMYMLIFGLLGIVMSPFMVK